MTASTRQEGGTTVQATLIQRGERYGSFETHAEVSQALKATIFENMKNELADDQAEALEMIAHKLARIVNGDPNYADSWVDIAGYATLVADRLQTDMGNPISQSNQGVATVALPVHETPEPTDPRMQAQPKQDDAKATVARLLDILKSGLPPGGKTDKEVISAMWGVLDPAPACIADDVEQAKADAEGWIEWKGGECPVPPGTMVELTFRDGEKEVTRAGAYALCWRDDAMEEDIVAYRLHKPSQPADPEKAADSMGAATYKPGERDCIPADPEPQQWLYYSAGPDHSKAKELWGDGKGMVWDCHARGGIPPAGLLFKVGQPSWESFTSYWIRPQGAQS